MLNKILFAAVRYCTLHMGGGDGGSSYDPAMARATERQNELGQEYLDFTKQQFYEGKPRQARLDAMADKVATADFASKQANEERAADQWKRYNTTFAPLEDSLAKEATAAGSDALQDQAAGTAAAGFRSATAATEDMNARRAAALGMKYSGGKTSVANAAALAGLSNNARITEKGRGLALKASVANMGRGLSADTNAGYGLGINAGNSAVNTLTSASNTNMNRAAGVGAGYSGAIGTNQASASAYGQMGARQLSAQSASDASDASTIGTVAGVAIAL